MESQLRPRDIQARIRSGETLEQVADAAGMPVEKIEGFAAPIIAEREHVVGMALGAPVRRRGETTSARGLRKTVAERLLLRGIDSDDVAWDAWKRADGRWALQGRYEVDGKAHEAVFAFDLPGRFSKADNDDARWLIADTTSARPGSGQQRRPADPDTEPTIELDDEMALVRVAMDREVDESSAGADRHGSEEGGDYTPAELTEVDGVYDLVTPQSDLDVLYDMISGINEDSVRIYAGLTDPVTSDDAAPKASYARPDEEPARPGSELFEDSADEVIPEHRRDSPASPHEPDEQWGVSPLDEPTSHEPVAHPRPTTPEAVASRALTGPATSPAKDEPEQLSLMDLEGEPPAQPKPAPKRKSKRASVPSWDEIMFGGPTPK